MSIGGFWRPLWAYRGFILGSVKREFQLKYQNSMLGAAWTIIQPLSMIIVYTLIFSQVMRAKLPGVDSTFAYSIYLCAGVLTWGLFAEITGRAQNMFIENANLLKKISFPRLSLPIVVVLNAGVNFAMIFGLFILFLLVSGNLPGWPLLDLLPLLLIQVAFAIGLGIILGVLNVFFRDVGQFFNVVMQFWFWLTPIFITEELVPENMRFLMRYNPMSYVVNAYRERLLSYRAPDLEELAILAAFAVTAFVIGGLFFRHLKRGFADVL